jgi:dihydrofolate reductase
MGKIVITEFVSLDGVMEDPGGAEGYEHGGWSFKFARGAEGDAFKVQELVDAEVQLLGRVTYQGFAKAWPAMNDDKFGQKMNAMPKYVVSTTLSDEQADWNNSTVIRDDVPAQISDLKQRVTGDILVAGSARLAQSLAGYGLVDEYHLMVFPVVLGSGKRLFGEASDKKTLELADSKIVGDGIAILTYELAGK